MSEKLLLNILPKEIAAILKNENRTIGDNYLVVGGMIGRNKFVYDVWGDPVNVASRMESQGVAGKIQITPWTHELIKADFICAKRGTISIKGKGEMETWFLLGPK